MRFCVPKMATASQEFSPLASPTQFLIEVAETGIWAKVISGPFLRVTECPQSQFAARNRNGKLWRRMPVRRDQPGVARESFHCPIGEQN
jgi:hypothetical protein